MFDSLANLIVYQWLGMNAESHAGTALHFFIMDTTKIFFLLFVIIYIMGLLTGFARRQSREKLQLGKMYTMGRGVAQNDEALYWYQKAAEQCLNEAKQMIKEIDNGVLLM